MDYLMFCNYCCKPSKIPTYIVREYFSMASHAFCQHCDEPNEIPQQVQYEAMKLKGE
ncbi:hypothetical protein [Bacillus solitudinis]|uniref:hypothetical protein n=1 Tax=Bacillus solitudinis TaxID=2014074 RepID=UPI0012FE1BE2|nr:hypothetical protein [Bacillus solitudinis]